MIAPLVTAAALVFAANENSNVSVTRVDEKRLDVQYTTGLDVAATKNAMLRAVAQEVIRDGFTTFEFTQQTGTVERQIKQGVGLGGIAGAVGIFIPPQMKVQSTIHGSSVVIMSNDPKPDPPKPHTYFAPDVLKYMTDPNSSKAQ